MILLLLSLLLPLLLIGLSAPVHADSLIIPANILWDNDSNNNNNYGLFIRDDAESSKLVRLTSESGIISIPDTIFLGKGENHAIFDVNILDVGESTITAYVDGTFYHSTTIVSNSASNDYSLSLFLPDSTSVSDITGAIYLTDDFQRPIFAQKDVEINFVTSNISLNSNSVVIPAGKSHALFSAQIYGDATISAYTKSAISDVSFVNFQDSKIEIKIGIAPYIISENSFAYLFVWFVDEDNSPFIPHLPITATVHTSDSDVIRFDVSSKKDFKKIYITDGIYQGRIDTYNPGDVTVTVNVPGFGSASQTVHVGVFDYTISTNSTESFDDTTEYTVNYSTDYPPNYVETFIYPTETVSDAWLVWSLYHVDDDNYNVTYPTHGEGYDFFITSDGTITHKTHHTFESQNRYTQSNIIPLYSDMIGIHSVSVTSSNFEINNDASFEVIPPIQYTISLTPLPFLAGVEDSILIITITDPDGFVIDPHYIFGDLMVHIISSDIKFKKDTIILREPVTILSGISQIKHPSITVIADNSDMKSVTSLGGFRDSSISIQIPDKVHIGEKFPVYSYLLDENYHPLVSLNEYLEVQGCTSNDDEKILFTCEYSTEFLIFGNDVGFDSKEIVVFANEINPNDITISHIPDKIDLDSKIMVSVELSSTEYYFDVNSDIPYTVQGNEIHITPTTPGNYFFDVIVHRNGYTSITESQKFIVTDFIQIPIITQSNGVVFPANITVTANGEIISLVTPDSIRVQKVPILVKFPKQVDSGTVGYVFEKIIINGVDYFTDSFNGIVTDTITAEYRTVVNIRVNDGSGSGVYDFGDTVILSAPPKDIAWFLIQDVFSHWSYLPNGYDTNENTILFEATISFETSAVYKKSHTGLIVIVSVVLVLLFALKWRRQIIEIIPTRQSKSENN